MTRLLWVEGDAARRARHQAIGSAIAPTAPAVVGHQQTSIIRAEKNMFVIFRIDGKRMSVLAVAILEILPAEAAPFTLPCRPGSLPLRLEHERTVEARAEIHRSRAVHVENDAEIGSHAGILPFKAAVDADRHALRRGARIELIAAL